MYQSELGIANTNWQMRQILWREVGDQVFEQTVEEVGSVSFCQRSITDSPTGMVCIY